jgi:hypothetical protein
MAYTAVPSKSTSDTVTGDEWNTYVKDNFAAGVPDIFTAKGDIAAGTAADVAAHLAVGANGTLLTAASGEATGLSWAIPSTAQAYARYKVSATRSLANSTLTIVNFDTSVFDTDSAVTTGAAWKFTVPADHGGYFIVTSTITLESNAGWGASEYLQVDVYVDGAYYTTLNKWNCQVAGTFVVGTTGASIVYAAAASFIDIRCTQNSGGAINVDADGNLSHVAIARLF